MKKILTLGLSAGLLMFFNAVFADATSYSQDLEVQKKADKPVYRASKFEYRSKELLEFKPIKMLPGYGTPADRGLTSDPQRFYSIKKYCGTLKDEMKLKVGQVVQSSLYYTYDERQPDGSYKEMVGKEPWKIDSYSSGPDDRMGYPAVGLWLRLSYPGYANVWRRAQAGIDFSDPRNNRSDVTVYTSRPDAEVKNLKLVSASLKFYVEFYCKKPQRELR